MYQEHSATVTRVATKRGTGEGPAFVVVQLAIAMNRLSVADRGELMGYQDHAIRVVFPAPPLPDPDRRPLDDELERVEQATLRRAVGERMRPLGEERCAYCGQPIGDDETAAFHVPFFAGQPRPVHGACLERLAPQPEGEPDAEAIETRAAAAEATR